MLRLLFSVLYYAVICWSFEFNNIRLVENVTVELAHQWRTRCTNILTSAYHDHGQRKQLFQLQRRLAHNMQRHPSLVLSFHYNEFLNDRHSHHTCEKSINVFMVGNESKHEMIEFSHQFHFKNAIWLFFMNSSITDLFEDVSLNVGSAIIAVDASPALYMDLLQVFKVVPAFPLMVSPCGRWDLESGSVSYSAAASTTEMRSDLKGYQFNAISEENWPLWTFSLGEAISNGGMDGFLFKVWTELEQLMNFTTIINDTKDVSEEIGHILSAGRNASSEVFLAELTVTVERLAHLDFLTPLIRTSYQVYFPVDGYKIDWRGVLRPFSDQVWIVTAVWLVIASLTLFAICKVSSNFGISSLDLQLFSTPLQSYLFILQATCYQGSSRMPTSIAVRILFLFCYLLPTVLLPYYSASLISGLTKKEPLRPFDTLEGILKANYKLLTWAKTAEHDYFSKSDDPILRSIYQQVALRQFSQYYTYKELLEELCTGSRLAAFCSEASLDPNIDTFRPCEIIKLAKSVSPVYQALAFKKGLPFREVVNYNLLRLWEMGSLNKHERQYLLTFRPKRAWPASHIEVSLFNVTEILCILFAGIGTALIVLMLEILYSKGML